MALDVANWTDKQLVELLDLNKSADHSNVANFIGENWLCLSPLNQGRIMDDSTQTTLRVTGAAKTVSLSAGVLQFAQKVVQVDAAETISIFTGGSGTWPLSGTGLEASPVAGNTRWVSICIKQTDLPKEAGSRWFVDDTVSPNTYATASVNTLLNKAYFDIVIAYSALNALNAPNAPAGYWAIAEIQYNGTTGLLTIIDTTGTSSAAVPNWTSTTRVQRLEFWSTLFGTDHHLTGVNAGHHKEGLWQIGATPISTTGAEINQALDGIDSHVTAANLNTLTHGPTSNAETLHCHGSVGTFGSSSVDSYALINGFSDTGLEVTISLSSPRSVLLMCSAQPSDTVGYAHLMKFTGGGIEREWRFGGLAVGGGAGNWSTCITVQEVVSLAAGLHTIKVQATRYALYHITWSWANLTVIAL